MARKEIRRQTETRFEDKLKNTYPIQYFVTFTIIGVSLLFLGICVGYLLSQSNWNWQNFSFPKVFLISTIVLGLSSYTMQQSINFFEKDDYKHFKGAIGLTFILGTIFCILQMLGWLELYKSGIYVAGKPDGSYLYLLSGLHVVHLFAGIAILTTMFVKVRYKLKDQVSQLLYFSDKYQLIKLKQIAKYWHFVDVLWVILLFFFLFNHL